ncbi:MAG TPA: M56 family metallopeptidase [Sedimentisphaerales bacterium]|nr:M56 family metallopeptidase [Sedimentisphaerales bacterium]
MNVILEQINSTGLRFVEFALPMFVQSGVLILILLLTDFALRKKVRAVFRYWIWLLVLVKLVLPTSLSAPLSLGYFFGNQLAYVDGTETTTEPVETVPAIVSPMINPPRIEAGSDTSAIAPTTPTIEPAVAGPVNPPVVPLSWQGAVFLAWLTVVITMGLLLLQRAIFVRGLVAQAKEANGFMTDTLESCRERIGVKRKVGLKVSPNAASPAVCGLFRPVILVPQNLTSSLSKSQLRAVMLHELAHIRRGDLWVNLAQIVLQIIYFYNPLLWAANAIIRRIREQAVDEMVLVAMGEKAQQYPQTLVDVAKLAFKRPALSLRLIGVVESKSSLAGRIKHILNRPMPKKAKLGILGLAVVIIIAAILLPMATCTPGPPSLVIKGVVKDAQTGEPIAGARVFDDGYGPKPNWEQIKADERSEWGAITNSAGEYSFLTWPEHHSIKVEAPGYKPERQSLYDGHFTFNKKDEETFDFALEPEKASDSSEFKKTLPNDITAELPMAKADKEVHRPEISPPTMKLEAKRLYTRDEPILLYLSWRDNGWIHVPGIKKKWILFLQVNDQYYMQGEFPMLIPEYLTAGVVEQGRNFDAREVHSPNAKPIKFPPGRYQVSYIYKDVSAVKPDQLEQIVSFGDIATNEIEFEVIDSDVAIDEPKFSAALPNGVTVELIGVCEHPSEGKQWWRPDGSKLGQRPFEKLYGQVYPRRDEIYELALKIENPMNRKLSIIGQGGNVFNLYSDKIWGGYVLSEGKKMLNQSIGIAQGPWKTIAEAYPKLTQIIGDIAFGKAFESDFEGIGVAVGVTVTYTIDKEKVDYRVIAVDQKSNIHTSSGRSGMGSSSWMQTTVHFKDLQIDEIKEFQFQTRPYQWVEFKNVSLRPGMKTEVQIEDGITRAIDWVVEDYGQTRLLSRKEIIETDNWVSVVASVVKNSERYLVPDEGLTLKGLIKAAGYNRDKLAESYVELFRRSRQGNITAYSIYSRNLQTLLSGEESDIVLKSHDAVVGGYIPLSSPNSEEFWSQYRFSDVVEMTVNDDSAKINMFADLDTGKLITPPDTLDNNDENAVLRWIKESGIEVMGETAAGVHGLVGFNLYAARVDNFFWNANPLEFTNRLMVRIDDPVLLSVEDFLPVTYLIKTSEYKMGILQILGFVENTKGIKIRYKLLNKESTAKTDVQVEFMGGPPESKLPEEMIGTWFFDNPGGDDEQMAIFPDGRVVVLYSNGHKDQTSYVNGFIELAEYDGAKYEMAVEENGTLVLYFDSGGSLLIGRRWKRIDSQPHTDLLRPLTGPDSSKTDLQVEELTDKAAEVLGTEDTRSPNSSLMNLRFSKIPRETLG